MAVQNKMWMKRGLIILALLILAAIIITRPMVKKIDSTRNKVLSHAPYKISARTAQLHESFFIADLHNDMLLWSRKPTDRHDFGHSDIPRLREGGVNLQVFGAVTKSPAGQNFGRNAADAPDRITKLVVAQLWPIRTWGSVKHRALYQAKRLRKIESKSTNNLTIIRTKSDLETLPDNHLGGLLALEGAHPLEGKISNLDVLYDAGYRMVGLQHFFDNRLGGSMHGTQKGGLTEFGREVVRQLSKRDMVIDVAHSSRAVVRDVLKTTTDPILISHGGIIGDCKASAARNLPDDILSDIAQHGGLIGVGYFHPAICDISINGIADTLIEASEKFGVNAIALGSDFEGSVTTTLEANELDAITQALKSKGMSGEDIGKIMGENVRTFLLKNLPD